MTAADIPLTPASRIKAMRATAFTGIPLYDALVEWDLSQGEKPSGLVPGLATEWAHRSAEHQPLDFHPASGVKFHDGTEVNADAIVWNVDKVLNKAAPQYARVRSATPCRGCRPSPARRKLTTTPWR